MKKIQIKLAAVMLMLLFSSCLKTTDDSDDEIRKDETFLYVRAVRNESAKMALPKDEGWGISTNVQAAATNMESNDSADVSGIRGRLADLFEQSAYRTTVYGKQGDEFISITYNGKVTKSAFNDGTYSEKIGGKVPELLKEYLATGTLTDDMKGLFDFKAMVVYKNAKDADIESGRLWFSYECTINPTPLQVMSVNYIQGTFSAKMMNNSGDTFIFTGGAFSCLVE